jgi:predicted transcriptional regulator
MRVRERRSIQASAQELIRRREEVLLAALLGEPVTLRELVESTAVPEGRIRYTLSCWHHKGKVRVAEWVRVLCPDGKYRVTPKFTATPGYDTPPPEGVRRKGMHIKIEPAGAVAVSIAIRSWFNAKV